jgi:hypothetical protein
MLTIRHNMLPYGDSMTHQPGQCHRILRFVHALFELIYTEEAASYRPARGGSLKALAIVFRVDSGRLSVD